MIVVSVVLGGLVLGGWLRRHRWCGLGCIEVWIIHGSQTNHYILSSIKVGLDVGYDGFSGLVVLVCLSGVAYNVGVVKQCFYGSFWARILGLVALFVVGSLTSSSASPASGIATRLASSLGVTIVHDY